MATAQQINISNFDTLLVESSSGRSGTPNGNVYFDTENDLIEIITAEELAQVDLGSGLEANPLTNFHGITAQAIYAFERQQRRSNTSLRRFKHGSEGRFQLAGAFAFVNGIKLASNDRQKIRGSGFIEYSADGNGETNIDRIYFGVRSLNPIDSASQPYAILPLNLTESARQAATPQDFSRLGGVDEVVQVYGDTSFGDAGAGDFDFTSRPLVVDVRTFGLNFGETDSISTGISRLGGFSTGFGLGDSQNENNSFSFDDIITSPISPFTGMSYESFNTNQSRSGFTDGSANFSVIVSNDNGGSLQQVAAFLDAIMTLDTDQDAGANTYLPKRGSPLYTRDNNGRLVTKRGIHLDGISTSDQQQLVQTDSSGGTHVYPFFPTIRISVSDAWANDPNGWAQFMYTDGSGNADFETANAVIVQDSLGSPAVFSSSDVLGSAGGYFLEFAYSYDTNTQAGLPAATDKEVIGLVEGDGGAQPERAVFVISRNTLIPVTILSSAETNLS